MDTLEAAFDYGLLIVYVKISVALVNKRLEFQLPGSFLPGEAFSFFADNLHFKTSAFMWLSNKIQFLH